MARDDDSRQYEPVVGPDAVPLTDSERDGRRLEVPLELVWCREPSPLERRSNGTIMAPVQAAPRRAYGAQNQTTDHSTREQLPSRTSQTSSTRREVTKPTSLGSLRPCHPTRAERR